MKRKIIQIEEEKCTGCGLCASACHEGAIQMVDGKARLIKDDYCDGLGDCLPHCPVDAISIIEREATPYDEEAVKRHMSEKCEDSCHTVSCKGLPSQERSASMTTELRQWPVQIKLAPVSAPYFDNSHLLIAADCTAYAYAKFHHEFMRKRITLIGCPKLDGVDYSEKLTEIIKANSIQSITLVRMEVPCCRGIENALIKALKESKKNIHCSVRVISIKGRVIDTYTI